MGNTNGRCSKHGLGVKFFRKENRETGNGAGGFYGCPKYGECGQYYCTRSGQMVTSKKFTEEK